MKVPFNKSLALCAYVVMVTVNYLAVALPIAGRSTGEVASRYPNLFTPAGYTFSIWGVIYAMLAVYLVYQFFRGEEDLFSRINFIFALNALLNASWIFAWHYDLVWLSILIMSGIVITLGFIAEVLRSNTLTRKERWMVSLPFNIYFGWITVAIVANFMVLMVSLNWYGSFGDGVLLTIIALIAGAIIGSLGILRYRTVPYGLVLIWAYAGILSKHLSQDGFGGQYPAVMFTAALCIIVFAGLVLRVVRAKYIRCYE